jgi:hypothetical protein
MMNSDPDLRYQTPEELIQDLVIHSQYSTAELLNPDSYVFQDHDLQEFPFWKRHLVFLSTCFLVGFICLLSWQVANRSHGDSSLVEQRFPVESVPALNLSGVNQEGKTGITQKADNVSIEPPSSGNRNNTSDSGKIANNTSIDNDKPVSIDFNKSTGSMNTLIEPDTLVKMGAANESIANSSEQIPISVAPFAVIDGLTSKTYKTLSEAVEFAPEGSIVEIQATGTTLDKPLLQKQVQLRNKSLVIRGKSGSTPVIAFNDESYFYPGSIRLLQGGKLKLQNLHLVFTCDHGVITEQVSLFNLQQPRGLILENVSITVNNPEIKACQLILLSSNSDEALLEIPRMNDIGTEPVNLELINCIIRGHSDFITARTSRAASITLRKVALGMEGTLIRHEGNGVLQREDDLFNVELDHVTCFTKQGILTADVGELPRKLPKINIKSRNSIFDNFSAQAVPLINMLGAGYEIDLISRLNWVGEQNFYQNYSTMLDVKLVGSEQNDFVPWTVETWKTNWGTNENSPNWNKIIWYNSDHSLSPRLWSLDYFQQDNINAITPIAEDVGADVEQLPKVIPLDYSGK